MGRGGRSRSRSRRRRRRFGGGSRSPPRSRSTTSRHSDGAKTTSSDSGGLFGFFSSWFSSEKAYCMDLYAQYRRCMKLLSADKKKEFFICTQYREEFEEASCGDKYASHLSSWWTEKDEKRLCASWSKCFEECKNKPGPENCASMWSMVEKACRGVKLN